jgi:hypothetical protein
MAKVIKTRRAGKNHAVLTVTGGDKAYRKKPCDECPWRKDQVGKFPAEAFRHSAPTAYDMAQTTFACHMSGKGKPQVCAGFLLKGSNHNLAVRLMIIRGDILQDGELKTDVPLHNNYREMAIANGVGEDEEVLKPCR